MPDKRERLVSFKLVRVNDDSAVIELHLLIAADRSLVRLVRLQQGEMISLTFDSAFTGDNVGEISDDTQRVIMKAKRHAHT